MLTTIDQIREEAKIIIYGHWAYDQATIDNLDANVLDCEGRSNLLYQKLTEKKRQIVIPADTNALRHPDTTTLAVSPSNQFIYTHIGRNSASCFELVNQVNPI